MWSKPQVNKEKLKDHNIQPVGLGNTKICPKSSLYIGSKPPIVTVELPHIQT